MRVSRDGQFYVMTHIPGPSHNMLALRYGTADRPRMNAIDPDRKPSVKPDRVRSEVDSGVAAANLALGSQYRVEEIRYSKDDTPRPGIYAEMARLLTLAMHSDKQGS